MLRIPHFILIISVLSNLTIISATAADENKTACEAQAAGKDSLSDIIIGATFKTLAKAFLLAVDFNKAKKNGMDKINNMSEVKFRKHYTRVGKLIKYSPVLSARYGFNENMNKVQLLEKLRPLDRKQLNEILDSVPDASIGEQFKAYINEKGYSLTLGNIVEHINKFLNKATIGPKS